MLENQNSIVVGVFVGFVWKNPAFAKEYKKLTGEPADPVTGEEIHRALEQVPQDPKIKKAYRQIVGAGPLPLAR